MQRGTDQPLADGPIGRIGGAGHAVREGLRQLQRRAELTAADAEMPQAPERPKLILGVGEALGDLEDGGPGRDGVGRRPLRVHERHQECGAELHLAARVPCWARPEAGKRALGAAATLDQERLLEPERHRRGGERHPDRRVAMRRRRPSPARSARCRSAGRRRRATRRWSASRVRSRPARRDPGNIPRGGGPPGRARRFRRASRARRPASSRAAGIASPRRRSSTTTSDFATRFATLSTTSGTARSGDAATALAASSVKPPAKTARRCRTVRSIAGSSS